MRANPGWSPLQQRLAFARDDLWEKLPQDVREKCHAYVCRLLTQVTIHERQERKHQNEREDPS